METTVQQAAALVAAGLRKNGWCQHYEQDGERCCMVGASRRYVRPSMGFAVQHQLNHEVARSIGHEEIFYFNDTPGRTIEEVLAVYDSIANS